MKSFIIVPLCILATIFAGCDWESWCKKCTSSYCATKATSHNAHDIDTQEDDESNEHTVPSMHHEQEEDDLEEHEPMEDHESTTEEYDSTEGHEEEPEEHEAAEQHEPVSHPQAAPSSMNDALKQLHSITHS